MSNATTSCFWTVSLAKTKWDWHRPQKALCHLPEKYPMEVYHALLMSRQPNCPKKRRKWRSMRISQLDTEYYCKFLWSYTMLSTKSAIIDKILDTDFHSLFYLFFVKLWDSFNCKGRVGRGITGSTEAIEPRLPGIMINVSTVAELVSMKQYRLYIRKQSFKRQEALLHRWQTQRTKRQAFISLYI